jgi:hypothetical protein
VNSYLRNGSPLGDPGQLLPTNLPEPISERIGRDDVLGESSALPQHTGSSR